MTLKTIALAAAFAGLAAAPAFADVTGVWRTPTANGKVEISKCGAELCGRLIGSDNIDKNPALKDGRNKDEAQRGRPLKGLQMLYGFKGGPEKWTGGKVYNPEDGGTYGGTIEQTGPDSLKLKGCIVAPLCKTQTWTRWK